MSKFNKHIKESFQDWEVTPPDMVWDNISTELDQSSKNQNKFDSWKKILILLF